MRRDAMASNGDKYRSMTDEELAAVIMCPHDLDPDLCYEPRGSCYRCCLSWLKEKAETAE